MSKQLVNEQSVSFSSNVDKSSHFLGIYAFIVVLIEFEGRTHYAQI